MKKYESDFLSVFTPCGMTLYQILKLGLASLDRLIASHDFIDMKVGTM